MEFISDTGNFFGEQCTEKNVSGQFIIVTGPNWAGKSSIFQAIKFAMGSNEKDGRYFRWGDFIHTGQDFARVTLKFQVGRDTVKIRRTVLKEGAPYFEQADIQSGKWSRKSAHRIGKTIQGLNYNPDNTFTFVSQGHIDAIRKMDPQELCNFLEEGIGVTRLRQRIVEEYERISRLSQQFDSLISQRNTCEFELRHLEPLLERLEEKHQIQKQVREFEDELLWANKDLVQKEIEDLNTRVETQTAEKKTLAENLLYLETEEANLRQELGTIEMQLNLYHERIGDRRDGIKVVQTVIQSWQDQKRDLATRLIAQENHMKQLESSVGTKKVLHKKITSQISDIQDQIQERNVELDIITKEYASAVDKSQLYQEWKDKYEKGRREYEDVQIARDRLEHRIESIDENVTSILQKIDEINHDFGHLKWSLEELDRNAEVRLEREKKQTSQKILDAEATIRDLKYDVKKVGRELSQLQGSINERNQVIPRAIGDLKHELETRGISFVGPILEQIQFSEEYGAAVESIFGEKALYGFMVKNQHDFALVGVLRKKFNAYCNVYIEKTSSMGPLRELRRKPGILGYLYDIVEHPPELDKIIRSITSDTIVVEDIQDGLNLQRAGHRGKCVTLDGKQVRSLRYAIESPPEKKLRFILSPKDLVDKKLRLEKEYDEKQGRINDLELELKRLDQSYKDIQETLRILPTLRVQFKRKARLTKEKNDQLRERERFLAEVRDLEKEEREKEASLATILFERNPDYEQIELKLRKLPEQIKQVNTKLQKLRDKELSLKGSLDEATEQLRIEETQLKKVETDLQALREKISEKDDDVLKKFKEIHVFEEEIAEIQAQLEIRTNEKELIVEKLETNTEAIRKSRLESEEAQFRLRELRRELQTREDALARILEKIEFRGVNTFKTRAISEIQADIEEYTEKLKEYWDVSDDLEIRKRELLDTISRVKQSLQGVQEEIDEANARAKDFKNNFFQIVRENIKNLGQSINEKFAQAKITATCRLKLKGTFDNLGIGIKAALGGEIFRPLSAMSGGQRTMVSICLMLGLQDLQPSPLCIFDEAEMFLDKKNAHNVSRLVKDVTKRGVQFVMIMPDHSKGLIKLADVIIGVTRQGGDGKDGGPSITVRLEKPEKGESDE